ncbi:MAG: hypothetical protein QXT63_03165 [Thermoplasmata archaeon]
MNERLANIVLPIFLPLTVAFSIFGMLVLTPGYVFSSDLMFTLELEDYLHWTYPLWNEHGSYNVLETTSRLPLMFFAVYLGKIFFVPSDLFEKIFYFIFPLWLGGFCIYFASRELIASRLKKNYQLYVCTACMLVFMLNPWAIQRIVHVYLLISYSISPLLVYFTIKTIREDKMVWQVALGSTLTISALTPHWMIFGPIIVLFSVFTEKANIRKVLKKISFSFIVYLLLSAFFIFPYLSALRVGLGPTYMMTWDVVSLLSRNTNILNSIRLMSYWGPEYGIPYGPSFLPYHAWIIASFALPFASFSAYFLSKDRFSFIFLILAISAISVISLSFAWTKLLFTYPFDYFGWVMRDPDKLGAFTAISFTFLFGVTSKVLLENKKKFTKVIAVILLALFLVSVSAMIPGVYSYFSPSEVPQDIVQAYSKTNGGKIIWMPGYKPYAETSWNPHSDWGSIEASTPYPSYSEYSPYTSNYLQFLEYLLSNNMTDRISDFLYLPSIRYLIHNSDIPSRFNDSIRILQSLMIQDFEIYDGAYPVFENRYYAGEISSPSLLAYSLSGLEILPTAYSLGIPNSTAVIFLSQSKNLINYIKDANLFSQYDSTDEIIASYFSNKFVALSKQTDNGLPALGFAKTRVYDIYRDGWRNRLDTLHGNHSWDFDYDSGLVCTFTKSNLECSVDIPKNAEIWLRAFVSPNSSNLSVKVGSETHNFSLYSEKAHFRWISFSTNLSGKRTIKLQAEGNCALNVLFAVSKSDLEKAKQNIFSILQKKELFIFDEEPFKGSTVRSARLSSGSASIVNNLSSTILNVPIPGYYYIHIKGSCECANLTFSSTENYNFFSQKISNFTIFGPFRINESINITIETSHALIDAISLSTSESLNYSSDCYTQAKISEIKNGDASHSAKIKSNGKTALLLAESYDALWTIKGLKPIIANSFLNLYILNITGEKNIEISYEPQTHFYLGLVVSISSLTFFSLLIVRENRSHILFLYHKLCNILFRRGIGKNA